MTPLVPDWERLNAYVDGELDAVEAAAVARALAENRHLAEQVALLSRLKAATAESFEPEPITLPERSARRWPGLFAAVAGVLLVVGLGLAAFELQRDGAGPGGAVADAWALHLAWAEAGETLAPAAPGLLLPALQRLGPRALVPDLAASGLVLSRVRSFEGRDGASGLHVGYRGSRGCRLSLFLLSDGGVLNERLAALAAPVSQGYGWRVGRIGYLLLVDGMDRRRFDLIARSVHRATLEAHPLDERTRSALRRNRADSRACSV